ncbi:conserved membrane hypothetical protein [Gammaproteobacteria bacterium]
MDIFTNSTHNNNSTLDGYFVTWILLLTVTCLIPIWWLRFLPMQDYPQHLFITKILTSFYDPHLDWSSHYDINLHSGAYALSYGLMVLLTTISDVETAGKIVISLYVVLMTGVVLRIRRYYPPEPMPWPLLLVFPLLFHQCYFLGFQSYLLSLPLLFFSLMQLIDFAHQRVTLHSLLALMVSVVLLILAHPYTVLVFLVLGSVMVLTTWQHRSVLTRALVPMLLVGILFIGWLVTGSNQPESAKLNWEISWWPVKSVALFLMMMFYGLRWQNGVDISSIVLWSLVVLLLWGNARRAQAQPISYFSQLMRWFLSAALLGFFVLPFWFGFYSYFNLRLAPIIYFLSVFAVAHLPLGPARLARSFNFNSSAFLSRMAAPVLAILAWLLVATSIQTQSKISDETATILPVLDKMSPHSAVLPVLDDSSTHILDSVLFYQLHAHDHYYYHIIHNGGVNPLLFRNPMIPVQLKPERVWPLLEATPVSEWPKVLKNYRYVLVRGHNPQRIQLLTKSSRVVVQSGPWTLLEVTTQ